MLLFFFPSRRRHTRCGRDWSSDVCSSDLEPVLQNTDASEILEPLPELAASSTATERLKASPAARKCATEQQIDLTALKRGSGPRGRILSTDVLAAKPESYDPTISQSAGGS